MARPASQKNTKFGHNFSIKRAVSIRSLFRITKRFKKTIRFCGWRIFRAWAFYFSYWASSSIACSNSKILPTANPNFESLGNSKQTLSTNRKFEWEILSKLCAANKAIFYYAQARRIRQLQNQLVCGLQILPERLNGKRRLNSVRFWLADLATNNSKCCKHRDFLVCTNSENSSTRKPKYFSESLGNSKHISNIFRTFEKAFPSKSFENFGLPGIKSCNIGTPYPAAGYLDTTLIFVCLNCSVKIANKGCYHHNLHCFCCF